VPLGSKGKTPGPRWDGGEFGGTPMPGLEMDTEGQYRAKQVMPPRQSPGVCNEHVPPTEVKICSGLHGNVQR
jgi:hypothetical protein